jgi:hypothetical protein
MLRASRFRCQPVTIVIGLGGGSTNVVEELLAAPR